VVISALLPANCRTNTKHSYSLQPVRQLNTRNTKTDYAKCQNRYKTSGERSADSVQSSLTMLLKNSINQTHIFIRPHAQPTCGLCFCAVPSLVGWFVGWLGVYRSQPSLNGSPRNLHISLVWGQALNIYFRKFLSPPLKVWRGKPQISPTAVNLTP